MKMRWQVLFWMMISIIAAVSCGGNDPVAEPSLTPVIVEVEATDIQQTSAVLTAVVNNSKGVDDLWFELTSDRKIYTKSTATLDSDSCFTSFVRALESFTPYYVKAYAGNGSGLFVSSEEFSFTTLDYERPEPVHKDTILIENPAFREYLLWQYDENKDGFLDSFEAEVIQRIEMFADEVTSIDEIRYFPNLWLLAMPGNRDISQRNGQITKVDVSANKELYRVEVTHNHLESVKFGDNPNLLHVDFCNCCLSEIDMTQLPTVRFVSVSSNYLTSFDSRGMVDLEELHVNDNPLTELFVDNPSLRNLDCEGTKLRTLDVSKCPKLNSLSCNNCPYLTTIYMAKGQIISMMNIESNTTVVYYE